MTQKSYQTRIKTGGSLIDFSMIKPPNPNEFLNVNKPSKNANDSQSLANGESGNLEDIN